MDRRCIVTTSWDDGHPLDLRIAELLQKYGLRGTFYTPMISEWGVMTARQIRDLGATFEIGAHTLEHRVLTTLSDDEAQREIFESKSWIEEVTGRPCAMFCPPQGRFTHRHVGMARNAGFVGLRTVELMSLGFPRREGGVLVMPTTVQAHPHEMLTYAKNAVKRAAFGNLWRYIAHGRASDWPTLAESLLRDAIEQGGVFHLWGHSWELQEYGQWSRLDNVLALMGELTDRTHSFTNGAICQHAILRGAAGQRAA